MTDLVGRVLDNEFRREGRHLLTAYQRHEMWKGKQRPRQTPSRHITQRRLAASKLCDLLNFLFDLAGNQQISPCVVETWRIRRQRQIRFWAERELKRVGFPPLTKQHKRVNRIIEDSPGELRYWLERRA